MHEDSTYPLVEATDIGCKDYLDRAASALLAAAAWMQTKICFEITETSAIARFSRR
jgi:hypothetical protein